MRNFIIMGPINRRSSVCGTIFRDVCDGAVANARYLNIVALFPRTRILYHALTSRRLRWMLRHLPKLRAWLDGLAQRALRASQQPRFGKLDALLRGDGSDVLVFVLGTHLQLLPGEAIDALRAARPRCRICFYLIDSVDRTAQFCNLPKEEVLSYLRRFDVVSSYNRTDVAAHPELIRFIDIPLWCAPAGNAGAPSFSLYFCGRNKKRGELLLSIHQRLTAANMRFRLEIIGWRSGSAHPDIIHTSWVPYERYVREAQDSNCLLEVLASDSNESTLRYKEAVMYNRKLLTTNASIASLPYYDPRWMRTFRTAGDIDLDWLRAVEPVDYGYRGDYSVETFLKRLEALLDEG